MKNRSILASGAIAILPAFGCSSPETCIDKEIFMNPPMETYGLDTWWHWSGGNISKDGIRKDLEAMKAYTWSKTLAKGGKSLNRIDNQTCKDDEQNHYIYAGSPCGMQPHLPCFRLH